jgi:hypothetical protein
MDNKKKKIKPVSPKKPYHPPQFVSYGHVAKFTQGASGTIVDGGNGMTFNQP